MIVMAVLRASEVRKMDVKDTRKKLVELKLELAKIKGNISMGASAQSPGRIKEIRKAIARIKTIESENTNKNQEKTAALAKSMPLSPKDSGMSRVKLVNSTRLVKGKEK